MVLPQPRVAVLRQGHVPPEVDGIRKPLKPGGYSDSSADIAYALQQANIPLATPAVSPDPARESDWSFPDTPEGIREAITTHGAHILWANTVLYDDHPIQQALQAGIAIVGQPPALVQRFDDKRYTNELLRAAGIPVPAAIVVGEGPEDTDWRNLTPQFLSEKGLSLPAIVKPIRGRGSSGVVRVDRWEDLLVAIDSLLHATTTVGDTQFSTYGNAVLIEEYLPGAEVTISVLPPGSYPEQRQERHWSLPPVLRWNHHDGIAPYSGVVAVTQNSRALEPEEVDEALRALGAYCAEAAALVSARTTIRIDCRQDAAGNWKLFDLNMKPNMTGAGRPGREDQDSLTAIAARALGWSYTDLVLNLLRQAWTEESGADSERRLP